MFAGRLWLITEFAEHGDFRAFLRSKRQPENAIPAGDSSVGLNEYQLPEKDMFGYALQVARGMEFLMSHHVSNMHDLYVGHTRCIACCFVMSVYSPRFSLP